MKHRSAKVDFTELIGLRILLETECARLAARQPTPSLITGLRAIVKTMAKHTVEAHRNIVDAIESGDADLAAAAMHAHLQASRRHFADHDAEVRHQPKT